MLISITIILGVFIRFLWKKTYVVVSKESLLSIHIIVALLLITSANLYFARPNSDMTFISKLSQISSTYFCLIGSALFWMYGHKEHWYDKYHTIPSIILFIAGTILLGANFNFFLGHFIENNLVKTLAMMSVTGITLTTLLFLHSSTMEKMENK